MPSKAQRAVTGVPDERWAQFGRALQDWREDILGYKVRHRFAADRLPLTEEGNVNTKLVQELENNYRPGTYTKWSLEAIEKAYGITHESVLAFLHGEADTLTRARSALAGQSAAAETRDLPPSPFDPDRTDADYPYALVIWDRYLDLPRRVTDPSGEQMFPSDPGDAETWEKYADWEPGDRVWLIADLRRRAAGRAGPNSSTGTNGSLCRGYFAGQRLMRHMSIWLSSTTCVTLARGYAFRIGR